MKQYRMLATAMGFSFALSNIALGKDNRDTNIIPSTVSNQLNLATLGAALDNSASDKAVIQKIYDALPNGAVVNIPRGSSWDGTINYPNPHKHITWIFDGSQGGYYPQPAGDGDISIQFSGGLNVQERSVKTSYFRFPASFFFWNQNHKFTGPYSGNYIQNPSARFRSISGPTSSGNTSSTYFGLESYGQGPSSNYDVNLDIFTQKYGQNSVWGIVNDMNDYSGKPPGAFASWNEFDLWANGYDVLPWDKNYGKPQAGHRSLLFMSGHHLPIRGWRASEKVKVEPITPGSLPKPHLIAVPSPDGEVYVWYAVKSGTTTSNSSKPIFPSPSKIRGSVKDGILTITYLASGSIHIGDYLTGSLPVNPLRITNQINGKEGGVGSYSVSDNSVKVPQDQAMYVSSRVNDGTVVWQFGENYAQTISSVMWVSGQDTFDTVVGIEEGVKISGSVLTTELAKFENDAAAVRMASGQVIDFTGDGKRSDRNKHTIDYDTGALRYKVSNIATQTIFDDGIVALPLSSVKPSGSTLNTALKTSRAVVVVHPDENGAGVMVSPELSTPGATQKIVNDGDFVVYIYPIADDWRFNSMDNGNPIHLLPHYTVIVTGISQVTRKIHADILNEFPVSNVSLKYSTLTFEKLNSISKSVLSDGQHARCSDCKLNGRIGVDAVWNAADTMWTDEQNKALTTK